MTPPKPSEIEQTCYWCKHWRSYEDIYEDDLEPNDLGVCFCKSSPHNEDPMDGHATCSQFAPLGQPTHEAIRMDEKE